MKKWTIFKTLFNQVFNYKENLVISQELLTNDLKTVKLYIEDQFDISSSNKSV